MAPMMSGVPSPPKKAYSVEGGQLRDQVMLSKEDQEKLAIKRGRDAKKAFAEIETYDVNMVSHQGSSAKSFEEMNKMFDGKTEANSTIEGKMNAFYMSRDHGPVGRTDAGQGLVQGAPGWVGDHQEFRPIFKGPRTEVSMTNGHRSGDVAKYKKEVNGIVPGYAGHVPRARDQYGESHVGGLAPVAWDNKRHMGSQVGHNTNAQGQLELMKDEAKHQKEEERFASYDARNGGVMPNYAGHRPGARSVEATSAYGKWKNREADDGRAIGGKKSSWQFNDTAAHDPDGHATAWSKHTTGAKESYRKSVGGVLPGYGGFVPGSIDKCGGSHFGGVNGVGKDGLNTVKVKVDADGDFYGLEQKGHGRDHKETTVAGAVKSGYAGHLPGKRDTWGMTHYDTINIGEDGQMRGKPEYVSDGVAGNEFSGQAKSYHDHVSKALHEH